jgi:cyclic pyranopterin phosphate synthase
MNAAGQLKPCLCCGETLDIKEAVRQQDTASVRQILTQAVCGKPKAHCFEEISRISEKQNMVSFGG